jgi:hypothetical protein
LVRRRDMVPFPEIVAEPESASCPVGLRTRGARRGGDVGEPDSTAVVPRVWLDFREGRDNGEGAADGAVIVGPAAGFVLGTTVVLLPDVAAVASVPVVDDAEIAG